MEEFKYINGLGFLLILFLAWAIYNLKILEEEEEMMDQYEEDCLNTITCGDCLRPDCVGCE